MGRKPTPGRVATEALAAYGEAPTAERAFGNEAATRCDLAVARVFSGKIDAAAEAIAPVLALATAQRINGIVTSADTVAAWSSSTVSASDSASSDATISTRPCGWSATTG